MKAVGRTLMFASALLFLAAATPQGAAVAVSCHNIKAKGVGQDLGGGVTTARIHGGGLLHGTTNGTFVIGSISGTVASFTGAIVFTAKKATLSASVAGTLDVANGSFTASTSSVAGTGKLAGATGALVFNGVENLSDGSFTENITGRICVDR